VSTRSLLLLAALVAALSWVALRQKGLEDKTRFHRSEPLLGALEPERIRSIFIDHTMTETYLGFENQGGLWSLTDPIPYPADAASVRSLLAALDQPARFVPEGTAAGYDAGFRPPRATLRILGEDAEGRAVEEQIELGPFDVDGMSQVVRARGETMLILRNLDTLLDRPLPEFRSRRILRMDPESIVHLRRTWTGPAGEVDADFSFVAERRSGGWSLLTPRRTTLDPFGTLLWLKALGQLQVGDFIWDPPTDPEVLVLGPPLARYGLERPQVELEWRNGEGRAEKLLLGKHPETGRWFAKRPEGDHVWALGDSSNPRLFERWQEFADRALVRVFRADIEALELLQQGTVVTLAREGTGWSLTRREGEREPVALGPASTAEVERVLGLLENAAVESWAPELDPGVEFPEGAQRLGYRLVTGAALGGIEQRGWLGEPRLDGAGKSVRPFLRPGDGLVGWLDASLADALLGDAEAFRSRELWELEEIELERLVLRSGDRQREWLRRQQGTWHAAGSERSATELLSVLDPLLFLRAEELLPTAPDELARVVEVEFTGRRGLSRRCVLGLDADGLPVVQLPGGAAARPARASLHADLEALLR
jgi:hypothetical protein